MGDTKKKIYEYLIEGATSGLSDDALFDFIRKKVPKANSKRIARAGFLALSDPQLTDRNILNVIYALAIKHRLVTDPSDDGSDDTDSADETPPKAEDGEKKKKK